MKGSTGVKAGAIIGGKLRGALCVLFSAVLVWSCFDTSSLAFADSGQSVTVKLSDNVVATLSSDRAAYTAGDTATFTITVENNTDDEVEDVAAKSISFADSALNGAVKDQLGDVTIGNGGKVGKHSSASAAIQVKIPADLLTVSTALDLTVSADGIGSAVLSIPVYVKGSQQGIVLASAADAGTLLSGCAATYDQELLKVRFGLLNYNDAEMGYDYSLNVVARETAGGDGVDITDQLAAQWDDPLPGGPTVGMSGSGSNEASTAGAGTVSFELDSSDEVAKYGEYDVTLTVTDADGNRSFQSVSLYRERMDLDSVAWKFVDDADRKTGYLKKTGTAWFSDLYYDNVAADPRVPFSDADTLKAYLSSLDSVETAQDELEKYIWDMIEPHHGVAGDYGDQNLQWPRDSFSPFHHQIRSRAEQMGTYAQSESGVSYTDEYFQNLKKTVGPDQGDANTGRSYEIELQAETNPAATLPAVYIIMVPSNWQVFDELHATARSGGETEGGSILTDVDEMANLYDVKNAISRLASYLKAQGSNVAVAIVNTQHGGGKSMIYGGYYTTNMDNLIYGVEGWDTFGDCEQLHWSCDNMQEAIYNLNFELSDWTDAEGERVDLDNVTKTVVAFGGATENTEGRAGYQACLDNSSDWDKGYDPAKDSTVWDYVDYLYGIRTVVGTTQVYQGDRSIYSWLDNNHNQAIIKGKNKYYTSIDDPDNPAYSICTTEDAIYEKLVSIYNQSCTVQNAPSIGVIDDATISDTVTDEFDVKGVTATWTSCDGTSTTSTWTADGGTAVDPDDPSPDQISVQVNADGTTGVSVNFGTLTGTGTVDVKINAVAKQDYLGSNNVDTNVGTPKVAWSHTNTVSKEVTSYEADFTERPSVNVPVLDMKATGGSGSGRVGASFNLKDYAKFDSGELLDGRYDQLNGALTLSWVEVTEGGAEVEVADDPLYSPVTYTVVDGAIQGVYELPSCTVKSDNAGTRTFKLKVAYVPEDAASGTVPATGKSAFADIELSWTDKGVSPATDNGKNSKQGALPATGDVNTIALTACGALLAAAGIAAVARSRKEH